MELDKSGFFAGLAGPGRRVSLDPRKHAAAADSESDGELSEAAGGDFGDEEMEEDEEMPEDEEMEEQQEVGEGEFDDDGGDDGEEAGAQVTPHSSADGVATVAVEEGQQQSSTSWLDLPLSKPLKRAIADAGWLTPTPVQCKAIPAALEGWDVCARAVTGSGKTGAFAVPLIERCMQKDRRRQRIRALVVLPTRELAVQCMNHFDELSHGTDVAKSLIVGGLPVQPQQRELRMRPDIVVATPGRLIDHLRNTQGVALDGLECLVLDEADKLLSMGFIDELKELLRHVPQKRQTLLFSATMTSGVNKLAELALTKPLNVDVGHVAVSAKLVQEFVRVPKEETDKHKEAYLCELCSKEFPRGVMVFCSRKSRAQRLKCLLELWGLQAAELHQNMKQEDRLVALDDFRKRSARILVTTEISARGLDISGVKTVINYDLPSDVTTYVHRVGRTARIGKDGRAVSFVRPQDTKLMSKVLRLCKGGGGEARLRRREITQERLDSALEKVESLQPKVRERLELTLMSRDLEQASRRVEKAENTVKFMDEIKQRPRNTWFASEKEKKQSQKRARDAMKSEADEDLSDWVLGEKVHAVKKTRPNAPGTKQDRLQAKLEAKRKEEEGTSKAARDAKKWGKMYSPHQETKRRGQSIKKDRSAWLKQRREKRATKLQKAADAKKQIGTRRGKIGKDKKKEWKFTERQGGGFKSKKRYKRR
eukprot:TRINITY_DN31967_c0_g1_i1.p1 TRINITY_DN31967_c0_g1~~TRINITY_DN31967_c0_g1_i1.p1  ORF type:complete len:708 (+),score=262.29 TRINITY_DN31967_c0_g1_i1:80-2203(+)